MILLAVFLASSFNCAPTNFENKTKFPWNENDKWNYETAVVGCAKKYKKSPCVKLFRKWDERDYSVICAKEQYGNQSYKNR